MSLSERDRKVIWHPYTQEKISRLPIPVVSGKGAYLFDEKGTKYIDAISSWWVNLHGHAHPYIAQKISEQLNILEQVIFAGVTHPWAVELAERLLKILPANHKRIFYSDNGSTAVEAALKMTFQYWHNQGIEKKQIIAFKDAYHGDTFGAMSVSGRSAFTQPFSPFLFQVKHIGLPKEENEKKYIAAFEKIIKNKDVAAFIFEPLVLGAGGMLMYPPRILDTMIQLCRKNGIFTIADEVMTGFGRTGKLFASHHLREQPDITCMSKGLTGGVMPLGATSCTAEIYEAFLSKDPLKTFFHGHSFTAYPLACVSALASLDLLQEANCQKQIQLISKQHLAFAETLQNNKKIKNVRTCGTIIAVELNTPDSTSYFNSFRNTIEPFFLERNILIRPLGNVLYLMPPYCTSEEDLNYLYDTIHSFLVSGY